MKTEKIQSRIGREVIAITKTSGQFEGLGVNIPKGAKGILVKEGTGRYLQVMFKAKIIVKANPDFLQKVKTRDFGFAEEYASPVRESMRKTWKKVIKEDVIFLTHVPVKKVQMICV